MNEEYELASNELEKLSELKITYYEPASVEIDPLIFRLAEYDIWKTTIIKEMDVEYCYQWYYLVKVRELNDMRMRIAEWKKIKDK